MTEDKSKFTVISFSCDICTVKFARSLNNHIRTHIGEKPYSCNISKKRFLRMEILRDTRKHIQGRNRFLVMFVTKGLVKREALTDILELIPGRNLIHVLSATKSSSL